LEINEQTANSFNIPRSQTISLFQLTFGIVYCNVCYASFNANVRKLVRKKCRKCEVESSFLPIVQLCTFCLNL